MQIKVFTIPVGDNSTALSEMNKFLRSKKILEVRENFVSNDNAAYWCFSVRYIEQQFSPSSENRSKKVDYKAVFDEKTFQKFTKLREIRKKVAAEDGIPAFAVFTDEELAGLAKLDSITTKGMLSVKGIGDKKVERFSRYFIDEEPENEKTG